MASLFCAYLVLVSVVSLSLGDVDVPCNAASTDCGSGECCATIFNAVEGSTGVCRKHNRSCTVDGPKEGECGCRSFELCLRYAGTITTEIVFAVRCHDNFEEVKCSGTQPTTNA